MTLRVRELSMTRVTFARALMIAGTLAAIARPASAQVELTGSYANRLYEDYLERGPGEFLGNFTGMPMSDDGRAKALLYTSNLPSMIERQCLAQSVGVFQYRPGALDIHKELDANHEVIAWVLQGDYLRGEMRIWMDGRPHPSPNAQHTAGGFATGRWEGRTLVVDVTHVKTAWIRRGVGIPGSDASTFKMYFTRHDDMLTVLTVQRDPYYLTEPHIVSRVWQFDPGATGAGGSRDMCNTANEIPTLEDTDRVPHYLPGKNPEENFMTEHYNIPHEAAMGYAKTLYPEYRKELKGKYTPPASCDRYCCGWIERQGRPGAGPGLTCIDGGLKQLLSPDGRRSVNGAGDQQ
jgi:hypothetical protein